ncbi:MAG TPA: crotonase [bacterium]|nr:crotonase [bacterium]
MTYKNLDFQTEGRMGFVRMNRPDAMNALNTETFHELIHVLDRLERDDAADVVIVTGEGKAFVAGADIVEMKDMDGQQSRAFSRLGQYVFRRMETMDIIFIAAVNGYALGGGCEFAMACDLRIASEKAKFGQPEVNLGVTPGFAGTQRLPRLIGKARAMELLVTGEVIDAHAALAYGLVNRITEPEDLMDEAKSLAAKIIAKGPVSVRMVKACVNRGMQADIDTGGAFESDAFGLCFASGETRTGMSAFLEKREPDFRRS